MSTGRAGPGRARTFTLLSDYNSEFPCSLLIAPCSLLLAHRSLLLAPPCSLLRSPCSLARAPCSLFFIAVRCKVYLFSLLYCCRHYYVTFAVVENADE